MSSATQDAARHMDGIYRYQRYIYDGTRKYYLFGRDRLLDELQPDDGSTVLEVGCGTGRNLIHAARRYPNARFFGFDISHAMLETARIRSRGRGSPIASTCIRRTQHRSIYRTCVARRAWAAYSSPTPSR